MQGLALRKVVKHLGEIYARHFAVLPAAATERVLGTLRAVAEHAAAAGGDGGARAALAAAQEAGRVPPGERLGDPPLLVLELEAANQGLSILLHLHTGGAHAALPQAGVEARLFALCLSTLEGFLPLAAAPGARGARELELRGGAVASTLQSLASLDAPAFRRHARAVFPLLARLVAADGCPPDVRLALADLLEAQVGPLLPG